MSTPHKANVIITNKSDGNAIVQLFHRNDDTGTQSGSWHLAPGQSSAPLEVNFKTGFGSLTVLDYWWVFISIKDGSTPGKYTSGGSVLDPGWKECQLESKDVDQTLRFSVDSKDFHINLDSGGCSNSMVHVGPITLIDHVFVLMLENHSFDNVFAMSGIPNITVATRDNFNTYKENKYNVYDPALKQMPSDPGHEFLDTFQQLCGDGNVSPTWKKGSDYPPEGLKIENKGFAANYATTSSEGKPPPNTDIGNIMGCFDTQTQLPVMYQLATEFAICDHWFSSIPGPTWPNRFFVHGASSNGFEHSPSKTELVEWETVDGFGYNNGSIYDALSKAKLNWRIYADIKDDFSDDPQNGSILGGIAQVAALKGISMIENVNSFRHFAADLQNPYPYEYTFIEPNYGDISGQYQGGSSQHPMDDVYGGEQLIKATYQAIRNSPVWESSLLVIIYDEHGGFYDSVAPGKAVPPGDNSSDKLNWSGFKFDNYGVRVPAIMVSPLIEKGTVSSGVYDHSSVPATLERIFNFPNLTQRDLHANDLRALLTKAVPRTDCPTVLHEPAPALVQKSIVLNAENRPMDHDELIPESGNFIGFLNVLLKAEHEMSNGTDVEKTAIYARFDQIQTKGDARNYIMEILAKIKAAKMNK